MNTYLTGFVINCLAALVLSGYLLYLYLMKKPADGLGAIRSIVVLIVIECAVSIYCVRDGNLTLASVIVWVQAVAIIATTVFIILIIIFKPDWK
ncbi:hypothetical protein DYBT9623_01350 [Dyadobacter sp. CECT 9623]|jgi:hypothetical protein|uniref:Uncharacterized protein n=1 Tax=Dyadobacter linearis TaxID=2823330 RepID=A0ABM8UM92_9BACT|nr:hypothetical protein [Dyadobacter sp. CECT 9623]CAG5068618.1 hypothetical protein DYBT9623_01350 [Dyadobacter sp. CECT 9623]